MFPALSCSAAFEKGFPGLRGLTRPHLLSKKLTFCRTIKELSLVIQQKFVELPSRTETCASWCKGYNDAKFAVPSQEYARSGVSFSLTSWYLFCTYVNNCIAHCCRLACMLVSPAGLPALFLQLLWESQPLSRCPIKIDEWKYFDNYSWMEDTILPHALE